MKALMKIIFLLSLSLQLFTAGYNPLTTERLEVVESTASNIYVVDYTYSNFDLTNLFYNLVDGDIIEFDSSFQGEFTLPEGGFTIDKNIEIYGLDKNINIKPYNKTTPMFNITREGSLKLSDIRIENFNSESLLIENSGTLIIENSGFFDINSSNSLIENYGHLEITYSNFSNNALDSYYGVIKNRETLLLNSTLFYKNSSQGEGGAIYNSGDITVTNSTFGENSAFKGGAIYSDMGDIQLSFTTIAFNSAEHGGGIFNSSSNIAIKNTLVSNNKTNQCYGYLESYGNNIIENADDCLVELTESDILGDPKIISFEMDDDRNGVYVVNHQSLAYGLADNTDIFGNGLGVDQTGNIYDERVTVGAYEYNGESYICNEDRTVDEEISGTILIEEQGFLEKILVSTVDPFTGDIICSQKLFAGDAKLLPYTLGTNSQQQYEIIFEIVDMEKKESIIKVELDTDNDKIEDTKDDSEVFEAFEVFDESLFTIASETFSIG